MPVLGMRARSQVSKHSARLRLVGVLPQAEPNDPNRHGGDPRDCGTFAAVFIHSFFGEGHPVAAPVPHPGAVTRGTRRERLRPEAGWRSFLVGACLNRPSHAGYAGWNSGGLDVDVGQARTLAGCRLLAFWDCSFQRRQEIAETMDLDEHTETRQATGRLCFCLAVGPMASPCPHARS